MTHHERHEHDLGLAHDVKKILSRRKALTFAGIAGAAVLVGCGSDSDGSSAARPAPPEGGPGGPGAGGPGGGTTETVDGAIPNETGGPYPADGSNGANVLDDTGIVRSDLRSSFDGASGVAEGVPLAVTLAVTDLDGEALSGAAVYLWHCDRDGRYSMYDSEIADENYLRGVQATDDDGQVTFTSIFPACYSGRWPHIHFEVYASVDDATTSGPIVATSQIALPAKTCNTVYATDGYEASVSNLSQVTLSSDNVFGDDGGIHQLATMRGDVSGGYTATLTVPVAS